MCATSKSTCYWKSTNGTFGRKPKFPPILFFQAEWRGVFIWNAHMPRSQRQRLSNHPQWSKFKKRHPIGSKILWQKVTDHDSPPIELTVASRPFGEPMMIYVKEIKWPIEASRVVEVEVAKQSHPNEEVDCYKLRNKILRDLGFSGYEEYRKSELWKHIRDIVFSRKGRKCRKCNSHATEVHHSSYDIDTLIGKSIRRLHPICRRCHELIEFDERGNKTTVMQASVRLGCKVSRFGNPGMTEEENTRLMEEVRRLLKEKHERVCRNTARNYQAVVSERMRWEDDGGPAFEEHPQHFPPKWKHTWGSKQYQASLAGEVMKYGRIN